MSFSSRIEKPEISALDVNCPTCYCPPGIPCHDRPDRFDTWAAIPGDVRAHIERAELALAELHGRKREAAKTAHRALSVTCPACGSSPEFPCESYYKRGRHEDVVHVERLDAYLELLQTQAESEERGADKLDTMVALQLDLMRIYGIHPEQLAFLPVGSQEEVAKNVCIGALSEVMEILNELPWKWWKAKEPVDLAAIRVEIADFMAYGLELALMFGMDAATLAQTFTEKMESNRAKARERTKEWRLNFKTAQP